MNEEKEEREKMRSEIEELRKMNEKLCEAIMKSQTAGSNGRVATEKSQIGMDR